MRTITPFSPPWHARLGAALLLGSVFVAVLPMASAAEGITGTWKWQARFRSNTSDYYVFLEQDGNRLIGSELGPDGVETAIQEGRIEDNKVSFVTVRERFGRVVTTRFEGVLEGDRVKGESTSDSGRARSSEWTMHRETEGLNVSGAWRITVTSPGGQTFQPVLKLQQQRGKLSGSIRWDDSEVPISDTKLAGERIEFIVTRTRNGEPSVALYRGRIEGSHIEGKLTATWGIHEQVVDWHAERVE